MEKKEVSSPYRFISFFVLVLITVLETCGLCYFNGFYLDELLCAICMDLVFLAIFIFELEYERKRAKIGNNPETKYQRLLLGYFICAILLLGFSYLPEYMKPFMLLPIVMCAFGNEMIGFSISIYLCMILAFVTGMGAMELIAYMILILEACILSKALKEKEYRLPISIIFFCSSLLIPVVAYYLTYKEVPKLLYLYCGIEGLIIAVFSLLAFYRIEKTTQSEYENSFSDIIQDDFPLVMEAKAYSLQEYKHCQRVSVLCYRLAKELGYDADLCAAAGFYYRMGRRIGQPYVENGVLVAKKHCFPQPVVDILAEYGGEEKKPSTPESAVIHMVDSLLIKLELFNSDLGASHWNKDMVVYQTLNELSNTGIYDNSGLSMNQFLKLRDFLVKEDHLY